MSRPISVGSWKGQREQWAEQVEERSEAEGDKEGLEGKKGERMLMMN